MNFDQLYEALSYVDHSRENRQKMADLVWKHPELLPDIVTITFQVEDPVSFRACWVLEYVCKNNIALLIPYLNYFIEHIDKVYRDQAVRPTAKICEMILEAYFGKQDHPIQSSLNEKHFEKLSETAFDWLINDEKVAVKAHAMRSLFLLGKKIKWIHPELKTVLEQDFGKHSAAYKARARHILKKLNK